MKSWQVSLIRFWDREHIPVNSHVVKSFSINFFLSSTIHMWQIYKFHINHVLIRMWDPPYNTFLTSIIRHFRESTTVVLTTPQSHHRSKNLTRKSSLQKIVSLYRDCRINEAGVVTTRCTSLEPLEVCARQVYGTIEPQWNHHGDLEEERGSATTLHACLQKAC